MRFVLVALAITALQSVNAAHATAIEPRSLTWNIVSDREISRLCRDHGLRPNCEGMAAWDKDSLTCVIWTRSPRAADDLARWQVIHHELQHCQEGHFHDLAPGPDRCSGAGRLQLTRPARHTAVTLAGGSKAELVSAIHRETWSRNCRCRPAQTLWHPRRASWTTRRSSSLAIRHSFDAARLA